MTMRKRRKRIPAPSREEIAAHLTYNQATGELRWLVARRGCPAGTVADHLSKTDGYRYVHFNRETYFAHRIIFLLMTSSWPDEIDHMNGVRADNSWANLRAASRHQNGANRRINGNSRSGLKGASFIKSRKKWQATVMVSGKSINLGYYTSGAEAHAAYTSAAKKYFGDFARSA